MKTIEIQFPIDVKINREQSQRLRDVVEDVCKTNCPLGSRMGVGGMGSKILHIKGEGDRRDSERVAFDDDVFAVTVAIDWRGGEMAKEGRG